MVHIFRRFLESNGEYQTFLDFRVQFSIWVIILFWFFRIWRRKLDEEGLVDTSHSNCNHELERLYTERCFDILNGFEFNFTRCINCHKIVGLEAKKLGTK